MTSYRTTCAAVVAADAGRAITALWYSLSRAACGESEDSPRPSSIASPSPTLAAAAILVYESSGADGKRSVTASVSPRMTVRHYRSSDQGRVLELVNADRLVGQPVATPDMLEEALAGRSSVIDAGWWAELADLATEVLVDPDGVVQGVLATAVRPRDGAGVLLSCHGREDPVIVSSLLGRATERLADRPVLHAFDFASALSLGLEALPVPHRARTDRALRDTGFTGRDLWRYAHRTLPAPELAVDAEAVVTPCQDPPGWRIEHRDADQLLGEAVVTTPVQGIGCCRGSASNPPPEVAAWPGRCSDEHWRCCLTRAHAR